MSKKDEILKVAARLFAERGFAETSIDEIVSAAGVAKGTLFYHFNTKGDLLADIMEDVFAKICSINNEVLESDMPGIDKVVALTHVGAELIEKKRSEVMTLVRDVPHEMSIGPESRVAALAERAFDSVNGAYAQAFRAGMQDGSVREVDAEQSAHLVHAFIVGRAKLVLLKGVDLSELLAASEEFIRRGFQA